MVRDHRSPNTKPGQRGSSSPCLSLAQADMLAIRHHCEASWAAQAKVGGGEQPQVAESHTLPCLCVGMC